MRASRASAYVANRPGCVHAALPSSVTIRVAARSSTVRSWLTNRIVFGLAAIVSSSQRLPSMSSVLSGSSSRTVSNRERKITSSASRLRSPPDSVSIWRSAHSG